MPLPLAINDLTARPIRFTADLPAWQHLLEALGGTLLHQAPGWLVYQVGSGRVALHASSETQRAGTTGLGLETTTPLEEAVRVAADAGAPITLTEVGHGRAGLVTAPDGTVFTLDQPTPAPPNSHATQPALSSLAIWYTHATSDAAAICTALGATTRMVADDGVWTDLHCAGGGLLAVHAADTVDLELAFEWEGKVEEAKDLLDAAGVDSALIDETYSRTLQIADPDGGKEIWVNERQTDLYGYTLGKLR